MPAPANCPICGKALSPNARGCGCGASAANDWEDPHDYDGLGLSDDDFDYDAFLEEEFGLQKKGMRRPEIGWFWWGVAVLLVLAFGVMMLRGL